jgi:hypothetical protein
VSALDVPIAAQKTKPDEQAVSWEEEKKTSQFPFSRGAKTTVRFGLANAPGRPLLHRIPRHQITFSALPQYFNVDLPTSAFSDRPHHWYVALTDTVRLR